MKKNARPKKPSRDDGLNPPTQVQYWLARLAQGFLEEGGNEDKHFRSALQKARRLLDMARGEGLVAPSTGGEAATTSPGFFEDDEVLPVATIAKRVNLPRTTLDGYITDLEGQDDTSAQVKGLRVGRKYQATGLWELLTTSEVTKKKVQKALKRAGSTKPERFLDME